jgi:DNA-binding SARP family transcriptional activator
MRSPKRPVAKQQQSPRHIGAPDGKPKAVRIYLLGGFWVSVGARIVGESEWRLKKAKSLMKLLALAPGHRMHRERLMDLLWPELNSNAAANNLRYTLHHVRRILEGPSSTAASGYLRLEGDLVALCPEGLLWVDVETFEDAVSTARRVREPSAYRAALDLYAGELLPEDLYEAWAENRREELQKTYLALLIELAGLYEDREELGSVIEVLRRVVASDPAHEEAQAGLMRLYALLGRRLEALRQYDQLKEVLSRKLGAKPAVGSRRLYEKIVMGHFQQVYPSQEKHLPEQLRSNHTHNLSEALTSFVGRGTELVKVRRAVAMSKLLTLTGAGGCGKTRLALEVTKDLLEVYPDGVWLVELAGLSEPELVPQQVADAVGVREQPNRPLLTTLLEELETKKLLIVLDNCEHVVDACAQLVETLLSSCPDLRVLATSREALGVSGEVTW